MAVTDGLMDKVGPLPAIGWAGLSVGGYLAIRWYRNKSAAATAATAPTVAIDPTTGAPYGIDPATGMPYATGTGGDLSGGNTGDLGALPPNQPGPGIPPITTNAQWSLMVSDNLISKGDDPILVETAIFKYLNGQALSTAEQAVISQALTLYGSPPEGVLPPVITPPPGTPPPTPPPGNAYYALSPPAARALLASGQTVYESGSSAIAWATAHGKPTTGIEAGAYYPMSTAAAAAAIASGVTVYQSQAEADAWRHAHGG